MTTVEGPAIEGGLLCGPSPTVKGGLLRLVEGLEQLAAVWELEPLVTSGKDSFTDIFSTDIAERLLRSGIPLSAIRIVDRGEKPSVDRFARPLEYNARSRQRYADIGRVSEIMARGATLIMEELQTFSVEVAAFAASLAKQTGYRTDCAAFLTPPHARGADPHVDAVSFFLLQVEGSKRWRISRTRQRWPQTRGPEVLEGAEEILDVVLQAGDCLYLPRGFVHVGETAEEASVHLSISVFTDPWATVLLQALSSAAPETELLREMPPPLFEPIDPEPLFKERSELLARTLARLEYHDLMAGLPHSERGAIPHPNLLSEALHNLDPARSLR